MNMPSGYFDRFDDSKNYDKHLFIAGPALQSAELNEIQSRTASRLKSVADGIYRDGDIVRDAVVVVDEATGDTTCSSGAIYLRGAVRGVPAANLSLPLGTHAIGIYLVETVVDATTDVDLKDPASGQLNYQRSGAARLKVDPVWGYDTDSNTGDFFPIYIADDRVLRPKAPPPTVDAVSQAIARYDRESTGGSYVVNGMDVTILPDVGGEQAYSVASGLCRSNGSEILFRASRRLQFDPTPDLKAIANEPHLSSGTGSQRVDVSFTPIDAITGISITKQVVETVTHGAFAGSQDALANSSVLSIVAVNQGGTWNGSSFTGGTTYTATTDYQLTANKVDWSPAGAEPATGSTYTVVYQYISSVTADSSDDDGLYVTGAVSGTLILVSYNQKMPRLDRIAVDETGVLIWLKGTGSNYNPRPPVVPSNMLGLATISQTWRATRSITNDGVRVVPMSDIAQLNDRIDYVLGLVAQQRLESSANLRSTGVVKGVLTDPFVDESQMDAGAGSTAAIVDGMLMLANDGTIEAADSRASDVRSSLAYTNVTLIEQTARTGSMKVNPYLAFGDPLVPPKVALTPSTDRWFSVSEVTPSTKTALLNNLWAWWRPGSALKGSLELKQWGWVNPQHNSFFSLLPAMNLRSITVDFVISGFAVGEILSSVTFDGVSVTPSGNAPADASGQISGHFTIPANIPTGTKAVVFTGSGGHVAHGTFIGEGARVIEANRLRILNERGSTTFNGYWVDPLAETFTLTSSKQVTGIDLWFTAKGTSSVVVELRETANGVPTSTVIARSEVVPASIAVDGNSTRCLFGAPVFLTGGVEYAIVVLSDDAVTEVAIAELGKQDPNTQQWVTAQPYQVGVLLSSSNAQTWTAHQDRDLSFRLLGASFTETSRTIALGSVDVTAATDLAVRGTIELPNDDADVSFTLTLPDLSQVTVGVDQTVRLDAAITGTVQVAAVLTGTASISPVLFADVQLLWGVIETSGTYYSRYITGGTGITVTVVLEAYLPGSSSLAVAIKGSEDGAWTNLTSPTAVQMDDGWVELTYTSASRTDDSTAVRLTLGGGAASRPAARNLRMFTQ